MAKRATTIEAATTTEFPSSPAQPRQKARRLSQSRAAAPSAVKSRKRSIGGAHPIENPAASEPSRRGTKAPASPKMASSPADYLELRIWAEMFDDAMKARIAASNRAERGGVDPIHYAGYLAQLEGVEHQCGLSLRRAFRRIAPPELVAWQKTTLGIGEPLLARLIGHIGHPVHAFPKHWEGRGKGERELVDGEPFDRTVSQLWSYCGHGDPGRKRRTGMTADDAMALGKPLVKSIVWLMAVACVKVADSPYREVYDKRRLETEDRVHADVCVRCGPSGRPAQAGSPWSKAHQHADALRVMGKEILRDIWLVSSGKEPLWK